MTKDELLEQCTIDGMIVKLPDIQLERTLYMQVNKALQGIGGKWNRKEQGFVFQQDPSALLGRVQNGENVNLKKEFQFFATPDDLADELVSLLDLGEKGSIPNFDILEPSAGDGALIKAIHRAHSDTVEIFAIEKMDLNRTKLKEIPNVQLSKHDDFTTLLEVFPDSRFNAIIANPPFSKNQDIDHIRLMYDVLEDGGRMVSIASGHWKDSSNKKETAFRQWLQEVGAELTEIERGRFKESGTLVGGYIIVIDK